MVLLHSNKNRKNEENDETLKNNIDEKKWSGDSPWSQS